jgi:hypothetical protein
LDYPFGSLPFPSDLAPLNAAKVVLFLLGVPELFAEREEEATATLPTKVALQ